jgi:serine/threonine-protein kinase
MSPEQARGGEVGPASDQFSLGVTIFRQLTGRWPFRGRTLGDVLREIRFGEPPSLRSIEPRVPAALERIVLRLLEKEPEARFGSMSELGAELDAFLRPSSTLARSASALVRAVRRAQPPQPDRRIHPEESS